MINNKHLSLVIPCRNEAQALVETLKNLPKAIDEIIVVDNGSTDNTVKVAKSLGAKVFSEERAINGIGYGFALARGIKEASGDIIICMDGDGSYPVSEIVNLTKKLEAKKLDFISCSRLPFKNPKSMSYIRTLGVNILNLFIYILFGFEVKDSLTGMWIFRKEAVKESILSEGGWNFSLEIKLNILANHNLKFAELSIPYHDRVFDSSKQNLIKTGVEHMLFLFRKRFLTRNQKVSSLLLFDKRSVV